MASRRKRHGFLWEDLPESENVEDRRGEPPVIGPPTFVQMQEQAKRRKATDLSPPDPTSQLAQDLGVDDIGKGSG